MTRSLLAALLLAAPAAFAQTYSGTLDKGDETLSTGEYADEYTVRAAAGEAVTAVVDAEGFDPWIFVKDAAGQQEDNDDCEGSRTRSCVTFPVETSGTLRVIVTSFAPGESGSYTVTLTTGPAGDTDSDDAGDDPGKGRASDAALESGRATRGALSDGDETLTTGEFVDMYAIDVQAGERLSLRMTSGDVDPYLIALSPSGERETNDDCAPGDYDASCLEITARESGTWRVGATSYAQGESGRYTVTATTSGRPARSAARAEGRPARPAARVQRTDDAAGDLTLDQTFRGRLAAGDEPLRSGEFTGEHAFEGDAGEPVRIEMASDDFDTYLFVSTPSGEQVDNDAADGSTDRSVLEFVMPETGRYTVTATSYAPGETGRYTVRVSQADAMRPDPPAFDRIVGVFVGISDYDRAGLPPLEFTAGDAATARDAMIAAGMAPEDGILLQDADATVAGLEAAFRTAARRSDARTEFVFFYSGHGGQYERSSFQREDPDGKDESLELYDAPVLDDAFDALLSQVPSARQMIVLDACYSGGFAKDVISQAGRMGLFSSEEDVVSQVASQFQAGGYLSRFFSDAVVQRAADADRNGSVTALELSQYLAERYAADVSGARPGLLAARETGLQHQKLVVDRGSVGLFDTLFVVGR